MNTLKSSTTANTSLAQKAEKLKRDDFLAVSEKKNQTGRAFMALTRRSNFSLYGSNVSF